MKTVFANENIEFYGVLPFSECRCRRADLIERKGARAEEIRSAVLFLIPYYVGDEKGNISLYARAGDYHFYADRLFGRILPLLRERFGGEFYGFADKSPIEETVAAAKAGLGVIGDNYMLINEKYGSFVFIGEILSTVEPEALGFSGEILPARACLHCGACKRACPAQSHGGECLSALTQTKGALTQEQEAYIREYGSAWGCDLCQTACPLTQRAIASGARTPIGFFAENRIPHLTGEMLDSMSKEEFRFRAFSWRGKQPLRRNLALLSQENEI
ncbi:MAG: epoxyqueuosine reductase [Clostridia bacterium]|nr:epoxyqueuosine reductase [Clostridia bacterium]